MNHKLLIRQLKTLGLGDSSWPQDIQTWQGLLAKVERVYTDNDQDRYLLERSLEMSSQEMQKRWSALKLLEEQWRSLAESTPDLIMMTDKNGLISFANRGKNKISKDQIIGQNFQNLYSIENQEKIHTLFQSAMRRMRYVSNEIMQEFDDQEIWLSIRINPILKEEALIGFIVTESDVTEVRRVAQEIEARQKAEEAVETKARFLANMSHEIRTPLNGILGMADLLADQIHDSESAYKLEVIQSCGETLLALINDILDFSKLEAGKIILENVPYELYACVRDIVDLLGSKASEKGLLLHYRIEQNVPNWFLGDTTRVRQVLLNLVGNAIKFTEKGEIFVRVTADLLSTSNYKVQISVCDTGLGISEEDQKRLFQSFSQVDAATTRKFGGTGLGLSICKGLAEAMGGEVGVKSQKGKGSEFYFTFVCEVAPARLQTHQVLDGSAELNLSKEFPLQVLIAEDNVVNQLVVVGFLKRLGYQADIASNGLEVLHLLKEKEYDLILMDCHMPEMDGFQATQEIIKKYPNKRPRIVATTASTLDDDRKRCSEAGMDDLLPKPITQSGLVSIIRKYAKVDKHKDDLSNRVIKKTIAILDKNELRDAYCGLEDVLATTASSYKMGYESILRAANELVGLGQFDSIKKIARILKKSSENIFAQKIVFHCEELEQCCHKKSLLCVKTKIIDLEHEKEPLFRELESLINSVRRVG